MWMGHLWTVRHNFAYCCLKRSDAGNPILMCFFKKNTKFEKLHFKKLYVVLTLICIAVVFLQHVLFLKTKNQT